jgi:choline dehydrogenase-like flavoprotein
MITASGEIDWARLPPQDVVVVGAGAVGIVGALDLARRGLKVLLLEAGPAFVDAESQKLFNNARAVGRPHNGLHVGRFRVLGGTTNFWGGQLVRFDSLIFKERSWVGSGGAWPLTLEDLEPYYTKVENLLGVPAAVRHDDDVFRLAGIPEARRDDGLTYFFTRWLGEKNFRIRFNSDLRNTPNLTVVTEAPVVALNAQGDSVRGVRVCLRSGTIRDIPAGSVILAQGTIEIARLLLHPLGDGKAAPWSGNPWLGCGFSDHLEGTIANVKPRNRPLFRKLFDNVVVKGTKLQPRLRAGERIQWDEQLLNFALHFRFDNQEHFENAKIFFAGLLRGRFNAPKGQLARQLLSAVKVGVPMALHYLVNRRIFSPASAAISLRIMLEQQQMRQSRVTLSEEKDPLGMQLVNLNWVVSGTEEIRTVQAAARLAKQYLESRDIADVQVVPGAEEGNVEFLREFQDTYHQMGVARMGRTAADGVVDETCRVHGARNLFVAGAAVFPACGFANPTLTAMAMTLRLGEHVASAVQMKGAA